jgi:hypothetical protein
MLGSGKSSVGEALARQIFESPDRGAMIAQGGTHGRSRLERLRDIQTDNHSVAAVGAAVLRALALSLRWEKAA